MRFDFSTLPVGDRYKLMAATIVPRPIAWITTVSDDGVRNAAPFSFFNMMAADPPLIVVGIMRHPDGREKDTARNIGATEEFVVNLVRETDASAMNFTCIDAPPELDELALAQIPTIASVSVSPPRIASAPVAMECRLFEKIDVRTSSVVLGEVLHLHIDDQLVDAGRLHVDTPSLGLIARMHGAGWYARTDDLFQMARPTFSAWLEGQADVPTSG